MNRNAVIVLAVLALALFGYIVVFERDSLSTAELEERRGHLLEAFVRDRVSALEIERDGRTLRLEREPVDEGGFQPWQVVQPWQADADTDAVDALLGELEWLDARRRIGDASQADLKSFGLDDPRVRLWFEAGGERVLLEVGEPDVHEEGLYVRVGGSDSVAVVPKTLDEVLDHPLRHFRTKQFLGTITVAWARHVEIHGPEGQVTVLEREDDRWWYEPEPRGYGDPHAIKAWLRSFDELRASRHVPDAQVETLRKQLRGAPEQRLLVKIIPDPGREDVEVRVLDMYVGGDCPGHEDERLVTVGKGGPVVCVRDAALEILFEDPARLRLYAPFAFDVSEIEALRLDSGDHSVTLERDEDRWVASDDGGPPVSRQTVEGWLADLTDQRARSFDERTQSPTLASLEADLADGDTWRLELGPPTLEGSLVRRDEEPLQVTYDPVMADLLNYWPGKFRPLRLWEIQPSQVTGLRVTDAAGKSRALELREGHWREEGAAEPATDAPRIREIVRTLAKMDAERIRAPQADPRYGLTEPPLTLRATLGGEKQLKLEVGSQSEEAERFFAQLDDGVVVELSIEHVSALRELIEPPSSQTPPAGPGPAEPTTKKPAVPSLDEDHGHEEGHEGHAH